MYPNIIQRICYWWWAKFIIDESEYDDDLYTKRISHWKIVWCKVIGHDPYDVEVGEHWASEHIAIDYAPVCGRCGSWL